MNALFDLGQVEVSELAATAIQASAASLPELLTKHQSGDWLAEGEVAQKHNEFAAQHGLLVASEYALPDGLKVLLVTAQDRSRTQVLLPNEYRHVEVELLEGYARWANRYDTWKNPLIAVEEPAVMQLLQGVLFRTALDVGVGTGRHAHRLAHNAALVAGIDLSPDMLKVAQSKPLSGGKPLALIRANIETPIPFRGQSFDLVVCALALSHVANLQLCLQEFARIQTRGGLCLISEFHPEAIAFGWRTSLQETDQVYRLPNHAHTRENYLVGLQAAGYRIQQVLDLRVADVPAGYFTPTMVANHGERGLCLIILAERAP